MARDVIGKCDCPACGKEADVRRAKPGKSGEGKPYIMCDDCGFQGFARGDAAVKGLLAKMRAAQVVNEPPPVPPKPAPAPAPAPHPPEKKPWFSL